MTYLIEGVLLREEKPEKYLHRYIDVKFVRTSTSPRTLPLRIKTERAVVTTTSKKYADWLNSRGYNLVWNDDLEVAKGVCERKRMHVSVSKSRSPEEGWETYLTNIGGSDYWKVLEGELNVWKELRIPTPSIYFFSTGDLIGYFVHSGNGFKKSDGYSARKATYGLITPIVSIAKTKILIR